MSVEKKAVNLQPFCEKVKNVLAAYDIQIHGLEDKTYGYDFEGQNDFFQFFDQEIIEGGTFKAKIKLEKNATLIRLFATVHSELELICDRSLELFSEVFEVNFSHIYKFGHDSQELDDEIEMIPFGIPKINIAQLIFDYVLLQVPIKKLHPRFRTELNDDEEGIMVYKDNTHVDEDADQAPDPRWAALMNLKNKDQNFNN